MLPERVIAIDPGKTTGYAAWQEGHAEPWSGQESDCVAFGKRLDLWLGSSHLRTTVVIERFIINVKTVGNSQAPWSLELIGVARYLAAKYDAEFELQTPADAKSFMPDDRLKKLGWYMPGKVHANDALRHLGLFLATHHMIELTQLM